MRRRATSEERWIWRHEVLPPPTPPRFPAEARLDSAWRQLVLIHTAFHATEQKEYRDLVAALREMERLFFDHAELGWYYDEWIGVPSAPPGSHPAASGSQTRHVVAIQAQFMEDVYFVLQLARFANALDNRGWMNLFRRWGRSKTFNAHFERLRRTFSKEFEEFYDLYVRDYPGTIDDYPVPHPWDSQTVREDPRQAAPPPGEPPIVLPGVFLDSGLQEIGKRLGRHTEPPSPGTGSHGVKEDIGNVGAPMDQSQSGEGGQSAPTKMPPNA